MWSLVLMQNETFVGGEVIPASVARGPTFIGRRSCISWLPSCVSSNNASPQIASPQTMHPLRSTHSHYWPYRRGWSTNSGDAWGCTEQSLVASDALEPLWRLNWNLIYQLPASSATFPQTIGFEHFSLLSTKLNPTETGIPLQNLFCLRNYNFFGLNNFSKWSPYLKRL